MGRDLLYGANTENKIVIVMSLIFFFLMIAMELMIESLFSVQNKSHNNDAVVLSAGVTLFQFFGCFTVPMGINFVRYFITSPPGLRIDHDHSSNSNSVGFKPPQTLKALLSYVGLATLVFCATGLATYSAQLVSYPTKVVFKSAKLVPTMVVSTLTHGKVYSLRDYFAAAMLCLGAICFTYNVGNKINNTSQDGTAWVGIIMLFASVLCDAIVPNWQQALMAQNQSATKGYDLSVEDIMINTNIVGFVVLLSAMLFDGSLRKLIALSSTQINVPLVSRTQTQSILSFEYIPTVVRLFGIGISLGIAVNCYSHLIKRSGSVVAVSVSTVRKIFTILLSYIVFPKPLTVLHMCGVLAVTAGIAVESVKSCK